MKRLLFILIMSILVYGCTTTPPRYPTSLDDIHAALQESKSMDHKLAVRGANQTSPSSMVNAALMPGLSLNFPASNNQAVEQRFDVSVKDAPARAFFMGLVQGTNYNMVVNPDVKGTISLDLKNVTIEETLDAVRDSYGYEYKQTPYGFEVLPETLQTQVFSVNYLDAERTGRSETNVYPSQISDKVGTTSSGNTSTTTPTTAPTGTSAPSQMTGPGTTVETKSKIDFWKSLAANLQTIIGNQTGESVVVNPAAGVVIVRAYPAELREVAQYLDTTQNSMQRQVIIEAKILEVDLSTNFQSGINWNLLRSQGMQITGTALPDIQSTTFLATANFSAGNGSFSTVINLLEQQGNVQVLSSPRISTVNNQKAIIKVGSDQFFVTSVTTNNTPVTTGTNTTSESVGLTPFFAGITLDVTPEISAEGDIVLHVHPSVSTVKQQTQSINLGATNGTLVLPLALSTIRESDSIVRAKNGQVVVIGGLMQNNTAENLDVTPPLSRIPFFGALFRNTTQASTKNELVILLRPVVVNNTNLTNDLQNTDKRFQGLKRGFHLGSSPEIFGTQGEKFNE